MIKSKVFKILGVVGVLGLFTVSAQAATIRCQTDNHGGNFSVLSGVLTADRFEGTLTRGINDGQNESRILKTAVRADFSSQAEPALNVYRLSEDIVVAPPHDLTFTEVQLIFQRSIVLGHRGGMVERGAMWQNNQEQFYQNNYRCIPVGVQGLAGIE